MKNKCVILCAALAVLYPFYTVAQTFRDARLDPIMVTATRQPMKASEVLADVTVIEREEIERAGDSNIINLLGRQPGIQFSRNGGPGAATNLYVRGARPDQTKVLVDGIPINTFSLAGSPLQYLSLSDVERIEIVRGAASAIYGADAIGGVINIITRRGAPGLHLDGFAGYGSYATRQADAGISGGNEHWRFRVHANSINSDGFSVRRHARHHDRDDDAYRNEGGGASLSFLPAQGHEVGMSYLSQKGITHYDSFSGQGFFDDRARFNLSQWHVFSRNRITEDWTSTLTYGEAEENRRDYNAPTSWDPTGQLERKSRNQFWSWQNDIALPLGTGLIVFENFEQTARPEATFEKGNIRIQSAGLGWVAALGAHSWQTNVRYDDSSRYGSKTTGGLSYGYQFAPAWRVSAGISKAFKAPSLDQLYNVNYGNPDLKPENALNREISLVWEPKGQRFSATYYHNRLTDLIAWDTDGYGNVEKALFKGLTFGYMIAREQWDFSANIDFLDAKNKDTDKRLGRRARQTFSVTGHRRFGALELGAEWVAAGRRYDSNSETIPMGGYNVVNLTASYSLSPQWRLEARADNIFDKDYSLAKNYAVPGASLFVGVRYHPKP